MNAAAGREMASFLHTQAVEGRRLRENAAAAEKDLREELQNLDALGELEQCLSNRQNKGR